MIYDICQHFMINFAPENEIKDDNFSSWRFSHFNTSGLTSAPLGPAGPRGPGGPGGPWKHTVSGLQHIFSTPHPEDETLKGNSWML